MLIKGQPITMDYATLTYDGDTVTIERDPNTDIVQMPAEQWNDFTHHIKMGNFDLSDTPPPDPSIRLIRAIQHPETD